MNKAQVASMDFIYTAVHTNTHTLTYTHTHSLSRTHCRAHLRSQGDVPAGSKGWLGNNYLLWGMPDRIAWPSKARWHSTATRTQPPPPRPRVYRIANLQGEMRAGPLWPRACSYTRDDITGMMRLAELQLRRCYDDVCLCTTRQLNSRSRAQ